MRGKSRSNKIFDFVINQDGNDIFSNLERLNEFLLDKPIDSYVLIKLMILFVKHEKKVQASLSATKRHLETYELKKQAIEYWRNNIDSSLSNDKAANLLIKIVPLSHRKLSQYIAEAKKQTIPLASKEHT